MKLTKLKPLSIAISIAGLFLLQAPASADTVWSTSGFEQPESVIFDTERNQIFVSNIAGAPLEANGKGYLSLLSAEGETIQTKWINGLNAPKGMAIVRNHLYVSDINKVHKIHIPSVSIVETYVAKNAKFLNDISAAKDGIVYISDLASNSIYTIDESGLNLWLDSEEISHPNGLFVKDGQLIVGTWGKGMREDFSTEQAGSLMSVNLIDKSISPIIGAEEIGNLDGVVATGDQLIVNDWITGKLYGVSNEKKHIEIGSYNAGLADIASHGTILFMPYMMDNKVEAITIPNF